MGYVFVLFDANQFAFGIVRILDFLFAQFVELELLVGLEAVALIVHQLA